MRRIHEGMGILLSFMGPDESADCAADHDTLYLAGPSPETILEGEKRLDPSFQKRLNRLEELNFHWDEEADSWRKFT